MLQHTNSRATEVELLTARRRGVSAIYLVLILLILVFFVSIGVDMGRVRAARSQLQTASDAAAFAGAQALPSPDHSIANGRAVAVAALNRSDGTAVALQPANDIQYGLYRISTNRYTPVGQTEAAFGSTAAHVVTNNEANAIKVTARRMQSRGNPINLIFARIIGRSTFDAWAQATAFVRGGPTAFGIVGINWIHGNGNTILIDSYLPALGPYGSQPPRNNGSVASNGNIDLGNGDVHGDVRPGVNGYVVQGPNSDITGWTAPLDQPLVYPPATIPPGTIDLGNYKPGKDAVLNGGTTGAPIKYRASGFSTNKKLTLTGPVEMYVDGNVNLRGATIVNNGDPSWLKIFVVGAHEVDLGGTSELFAHVYAPQSNVTIHGTPGFYGAIVGLTLDLKGTCTIHYDESSNPFSEPLRSVLIK